MKMYKVQAEENGNALYCDMLETVNEYIGDVGEEPILVSRAEMTEEEFDALPEFVGF